MKAELPSGALAVFITRSNTFCKGVLLDGEEVIGRIVHVGQSPNLPTAFLEEHGHHVAQSVSYQVGKQWIHVVPEGRQTIGEFLEQMGEDLPPSVRRDLTKKIRPSLGQAENYLE